MSTNICLQKNREVEKIEKIQIEKVQIEQIQINEKEDIYKELIDLPENISLYKCHNCKAIFDIFSNMEAGVGIFIALNSLTDRCNVVCPECKTNMTELMCKVDGYSCYLKIKGFKCRENKLMAGADLCPVCNNPMCGVCYNHSVVSLSRVTGYMQDISGWNAGKVQELKDRKRYTINS